MWLENESVKMQSCPILSQACANWECVLTRRKCVLSIYVEVCTNLKKCVLPGVCTNQGCVLTRRECVLI